ncbi:MaoC family dehydratase [Halapricum hydrolyticum]|uniref:MaoC family dehydratase n=1 Tax=Halapricum hydrolyticum TaxID=2979991 RepID=A0AAE3IBF6_9EURY|nr:MaoC family dehydratase [Halapricum hydrolyticum]MCU4718486.1 MaoC family dehydratase [Halapricum hydrolyticum]MCU4727495.1 MaoC family dehydratase [Halapricum hydrolyticum]
MPIYFEDLSVGDTETFGTYTVTREEIVEFARQYDPQPFHVDPEAAAQSPFGGLVASGWHTTAMTMRVLVDGFLARAATRGALGVDELRWYDPVRPGDTLSARSEVLATESWSDDYGKADVRVETRVEDDVVCSMIGLILFAKRES